MIFIGPTLLSGIGQHASKYTRLFPESKYYNYADEIPETEHGLLFVIPIPQTLERIPYIKSKVKNLACMTVCETTEVHEDYGLLFKHFKRVAVPSEFCQEVFSRQFPETEFYVVHAHIPEPEVYTFYHIGNILDDRKQFKSILEAFIRLNEPTSRLLVKATCLKDVPLNIPRVEVVNGLVTDEQMERIHKIGDCYVSFSKSEGVGMGAVEAALRDKPVIITDFGGAPEYVKTPYLVPCELQELERDDFLFKKGMRWGKPDTDKLLEFMRDAFTKKLRYMDHTHTKNLVGKEAVLHEFFTNVIGREHDETNQ
ncbi:putative glycosyl transferase [Dishui Lake phycodnavirus 2]|nr:putative glycosyl transferase [Dishui Lake phycodnavirus 2]